MTRQLLIAAGLLLLTGGSAFAQGYSRDAPRDYMQAPPPDWDHRGSWHRMSEERRREFWEQRRRASWRCDHGDRGACRWLHEHEPA
jgi:hypothetical protein